MTIINKILKESMTGKTEAAGVLIICTGTKRALIEKRNDRAQVWGTFGGMVDPTDASIKDAVVRELKEETGYVDPIVLLPIFDYVNKDFTYYTYLGFVDEEFVPTLSKESLEYAWCNWQELWEKEPKHTGFDLFLNSVGDKLEPFLVPKSTLVESIIKEAAKVPFVMPDIPNTINFWHGGNLDEYSDTISQKSGRYEYGPGLYLTTSYDVASLYAKGNRKLYLVTVEKGTDLGDSTLPMSEVNNFIAKYCIGSLKKEMLNRFQKFIENDAMPADVFGNIILNSKAIKSTNTIELRNLYIRNNIDYELVENSFGYGELMMVLYKMDKIVKYTKITSQDDIPYYNLRKKK